LAPAPSFETLIEKSYSEARSLASGQAGHDPLPTCAGSLRRGRGGGGYARCRTMSRVRRSTRP